MTWRKLIFYFVGVCTVLAAAVTIALGTWHIAGFTGSVVAATRVAHDETRAELADTLVRLGDTLVELGACEEQINEPTNYEVSNDEG